MTADQNQNAKDTRMQAQEFVRNFVQVPPMPRSIPAPKPKQEREQNTQPANDESGVLPKTK